jgi:cytochrome c5
MAEVDQPRKGSNPIRIAAGVVTASVGLVVAIIMIAELAIGSLAKLSKNDPALSPEATARRLKPVGNLVVMPPGTNPPAQSAAPAAPPQAEAGGEASAQPPAQTAAVAPPAAPPAGGAQPAAGESDLAKGKTTYDAVCIACHGTGVLNAPKAGDKAAWAPRIAKGVDALYESALHGKGQMPAKGGNPGLADADVKAAVEFLVSQAK